MVKPVRLHGVPPRASHPQLHRDNFQWQRLHMKYASNKGSPGGTVVKNPPANARDTRDTDSSPGSGGSPEGEHGNPLQYSCPRIPWTEEPGGLQSKGLKRVRHDNTHTQINQLGFVLLLFSWCKAASWWGSHVKVGLLLPWHMMLFFPRTVLFLQLQHIIPLTPPWLKYCDYHSAEYQKENWNLSKLPLLSTFPLESWKWSSCPEPHLQVEFIVAVILLIFYFHSRVLRVKVSTGPNTQPQKENQFQLWSTYSGFIYHFLKSGGKRTMLGENHQHIQLMWNSKTVSWFVLQQQQHGKKRKGKGGGEDVHMKKDFRDISPHLSVGFFLNPKSIKWNFKN